MEGVGVGREFVKGRFHGPLKRQKLRTKLADKLELRCNQKINWRRRIDLSADQFLLSFLCTVLNDKAVANKMKTNSSIDYSW